MKKRNSKRVVIALVVLGTLTACGTTAEPVRTQTPTPTRTMSLEECAKKEFEKIKKELGVDYLIDHKDEANTRVYLICKE